MLGLGNKMDGGTKKRKGRIGLGKKCSEFDCGYVGFEVPMEHLGSL